MKPRQQARSKADAIHGGTWMARYKQAGGELSKEEADALVKKLRRDRKRKHLK